MVETQLSELNKMTFHLIEHWLLVLDIIRFFNPSTGVYKQQIIVFKLISSTKN